MRAEVVGALAETFVATPGPLAVRLLRALEAGQAAGGERRGMESAALVVRRPGGGYGGTTDRLVDLRVDSDEQPITALAHLYELHDLFFGATPAEQWVPFDADLRAEVAGRLGRARRMDPGADLEQSLTDYLGWENLEDRWHGMAALDPVVLAELRRRLP